MTFSLLARDPGTGALCGAAATGNLCVGGWVLRGDSRAGLTASQGAAPSHLWGEDALEAMRGGRTAAEAVAAVVEPDAGRDWRQLSALDLGGGTAAHTGSANDPWRGDIAASGLVVAGNLLSGPEVIDALRAGFLETGGEPAERLLAGLAAAQAAGGDRRGLMSAAILVLTPDAAPLTLRVDHAADPVAALADLLARVRDPDYARWLPHVPSRAAPFRHPAEAPAKG